jgi:hypothetical protein
MQAILNIEPNEIDERLLNVIRELLSRNVDITLKRQHFELKEFDATLPLDEVIGEFQKAGYSDDFISDLRSGFETSEIYSK